MSLLDTIYNYNEPFVRDELVKQSKGLNLDEGVLSDVLCVALNHVTPKYIKHSVDCAFYTQDAEREATRKQIETAVADALKYINSQSF
jgi:Late competence development protein ComFB